MKGKVGGSGGRFEGSSFLLGKRRFNKALRKANMQRVEAMRNQVSIFDKENSFYQSLDESGVVAIIEQIVELQLWEKMESVDFSLVQIWLISRKI